MLQAGVLQCHALPRDGTQCGSLWLVAGARGGPLIACTGMQAQDQEAHTWSLSPLGARILSEKKQEKQNSQADL